MTRHYRFHITIIAAFMAVLLAGAAVAEDGDGGYAGAFFQIPIGARPTAMGGAYMAVSDDGAGVLYNPAGLSSIRRPIFGTSYRLMKLDRQVGYAALLFPAKGQSTIGASWLYAGAGDVEGRDNDGALTGNTFSMNNHAFSLLFAKRMIPLLSAGMKASYLHSLFAEMTAYSVAFDLGVMFYLDELVDRERRDLMPVQDIRVGLAVKHIESKYIWNNEDYQARYVESSRFGSEQQDKVPTEFGLGVSARFFERKLLAAADVRKNTEQGLAFHGGLEYMVRRDVAFRGGYCDGRFTAGTGYIFKMGDHALAIDYAFSTDRADEGSEHIFSLDLLW